MQGISSVNGSESVILELLCYACVLNFCDGKTPEVFKSLSKAKELLYVLPKCPIETIVMIQIIVGIFFEEDQ